LIIVEMLSYGIFRQIAGLPKFEILRLFHFLIGFSNLSVTKVPSDRIGRKVVGSPFEEIISLPFWVSDMGFSSASGPRFSAAPRSFRSQTSILTGPSGESSEPTTPSNESSEPILPYNFSGFKLI
tara:strand:- start:1938 stop:2312 length:375 start_codon:yes stop_codon:yes gene_type:complete